MHTELLFDRRIHGMAGRVLYMRPERRYSLGHGAGDIAKSNEADRCACKLGNSGL